VRTYVLTEQADSDLAEIIRYTIRQWGLEQAERYTKILEREFQRIARGDISMRTFSDRFPTVIVRKCEHHYIFAQKEGNQAIILAVLHKNMDYFRHLAKRLKT
jgi:toxin ParE1/3/4